MQRVGPALQRDAHGPAAGAPVLGIVGVRLHLELTGGVRTQHQRQVGRPGVLHVGVRNAVQQELIGQPLAAVHVEVLHAVVVPGPLRPAGLRIGPRDARGKQGQHHRVPPQQRHFVDRFGVDHLAFGGVARAQQRRLGRHRDLLAGAAHLHGEIDLHAVAQPQLHAAADVLLEARRRCAHTVAASREVGYYVETARVGGGLLSRIRLKAARFNLGACDRRTLLVGHGTGNRAAELLGRGEWKQESETR